MGVVNRPGISSIKIGDNVQYGGNVEFAVPGATLDPDTGQITIPTGGDSNVDNFTLTAQNILDKYILLTLAPTAPTSIILTVKGLPPQYYGDDFEIVALDGGKRLTWDGLGLENLLEELDKITVIYS